MPDVFPKIKEVTKIAIEAKTLYPAANPSKPSNQFIAFVIPTIQKQVNKWDQNDGKLKSMEPK